MQSILETIKKMLGIDAEYTAFDTDIIININTALMSVSQFGIGPVGGLVIQGSSENWTDLLGESTALEAVKTYIYLKVKLAFDPPTSSFVVESINRTLLELEYRLILQAEFE